MKISIDGEIDATKGGRQGFLSMLSEYLAIHHGFKIVGKNDKSDIHLNSIHGSVKSGAVNFLRIDGIYYDHERLSKNKSIFKSAKTHDHIIFQSEFSKVNFEKFAGWSIPCSIIFNGAERKAVANRGVNDLVIGCSAKWRVNKRLDGIVRAIEVARKRTNRNIRLKVIGAPDMPLPSFCFSTGHIDNARVQHELSSCKAFAHVCHIESCPNSVVEALIVGLPVLCNNIGGTRELVKSDGVISNIDSWDWHPIKHMQSTKMNEMQIDTLSNGIIDILEFNNNVIRDDLLMSNSAKMYADLFKRKIK